LELFRVFGSILLNDAEARRGLSDIDRQAGNTGNRLGTVGKAGQAMGATIMKYAAMATASLATMGGAMAGIQYDAQLEQSNVAWKTLLGTQEKAADMLDRIAKFAKATPFETSDVDMMAKYMHNAGLEGQGLFDALMKVSDVASAFAIPAADAKELTRQMSQVRQAGVAYTEDLNILQDRGVPIFKALAKELNTNVANVKKMASQGSITSDIYIKAFNGIADSVKGASDAQSKTMTGMLSTLSDNLKMISGALMEGLFNRLKDALNVVLPLLDRFSSTLKDKGLKAALTELFPPSIGSIINQMMTGLQNLHDRVKEGIDGIFTLFNGNKGAGISMLDDFGLGSDAINLVVTSVDKIKSSLQILKGAFDIFNGDSIGGITFLTKMGFSTDTIVKVVSVVNGIKSTINNFVSSVIGYYKGLFSGDGNIGESFVRIFNVVKSIALPILQDIVAFVKDKLAMIKKFWDENGAQITQAVKNVWNIIATVFEFIAPVILAVVKMLWESVKGVIDGALNIIMGLIKVFAGLFTGDFSKMWEGIKQLFMGAIEFVWNLINLLMFGRILGGIKSFVVAGGEAFTGFMTKTIEIFKNLDTYLFDFIKSMFSKLIGLFRGFVDGGVQVFGTLRTFGANIFESLWAALKSVGGRIVSGVTGFFRDMFTGAKFQFESLLNKAKSIFNSVKDAIMNPIETAKNTVVKMIDKIKSAFSNMGVKIPLPHFSVSNFSLNPKDWVTKGLPKLSIDWYAKGTNFAPGGLAIVGEQGPELINLPRGSKVSTANQTKQMLNGGVEKLVIEAPVIINDVEIGRALFPIIDLMQTNQFSSQVRFL
jgi:tape measure domain-containing protein